MHQLYVSFTQQQAKLHHKSHFPQSQRFISGDFDTLPIKHQLSKRTLSKTTSQQLNDQKTQLFSTYLILHSNNAYLEMSSLC